MEQITKKEFMDIAEKGLNYYGSSWSKNSGVDQINQLTTKNMKLVARGSRMLMNRSLTSLKFLTNTNSHSYLDISGKVCTIHKLERGKITLYAIMTIYAKDTAVVIYGRNKIGE